MHARTLLLALGGITVLCSGTAEAHFTLVQPPSSLTTEDGGKGAPPCGEGIASNIVTRVQGGHSLTIKLVEFVPHPGHYRIALSVNSRAELPPDPEVVADANGLSVSAAIQNPPQIPVLADGLFVHSGAPDSVWQTDIRLPNINCSRCTLQVIEFMGEHGPNVGGGYFYHHCADLQITADPNVGPPQNAAWMRVAINPGSVSLKPAATQQFTASVAGNDNTAVVWTATNGAISGAGLYTAPPTSGTYTVTATSVADPTKSASATVSASAQDQKLYFPQFGNGSQAGASIVSEITLLPLVVGAAASVAIEVNDDAGNPLSVNLNGAIVAGRQDVVIPANASITLRTDGQGPIQTGSVMVSSDVKLSGVILFGGSIGMTGVADSKPLKKFVAPIRVATGVNTGVALMGLGKDQTVHLVLRTQQGNLVARASLPLGAKAHLAKFINEFAWDSAVDFSNFSGNLTASGTADLAAAVILVRPKELAVLPVAEISP
ncbi:MAG TPA: SCE4755 family polysaccharide monooxygenase-like protein [Acidobacteriota bacterium]|jgi:hypothetical protein